MKYDKACFPDIDCVDVIGVWWPGKIKRGRKSDAFAHVSTTYVEPIHRDPGASIGDRLPAELLTALLPDNLAKNNPQHILVHRLEEFRRTANRKRDQREARRRLLWRPPNAAEMPAPPTGAFSDTSPAASPD